MTHRDRLRRQLVRALVRENLDAIRGCPRRAFRRSRRIGGAVLRGYRLVVAPALLFLAITVLSTGGSDWRGLSPKAQSLEALSTRLAVSAPHPIHVAAFSLGVKRIVLDPGHGGADPGAQTSFQLAEKEITLDVALRLRTLLQESGFEVAMTREGDETVSLRERAASANGSAGDLFVSIHVNAIPSREHCGIETYYIGPTGDPHVEQLASRENREPGYSLADFRPLLERLYVHVRQRESQQFAEVVQRGLVTFLKRSHRTVKDNGVRTAPFLVLVATDMPSILTELSCLSNEEQGRALADPGHRQNVARGLFVGIRAYADARNRLGRNGSS